MNRAFAEATAWQAADLKLAPFPNSLAATLRGFAFYLTLPVSSIPGCHGVEQPEKQRTTGYNGWISRPASALKLSSDLQQRDRALPDLSE